MRIEAIGYRACENFARNMTGDLLGALFLLQSCWVNSYHDSPLLEFNTNIPLGYPKIFTKENRVVQISKVTDGKKVLLFEFADGSIRSNPLSSAVIIAHGRSGHHIVRDTPGAIQSAALRIGVLKRSGEKFPLRHKVCKMESAPELLAQ